MSIAEVDCRPLKNAFSLSFPRNLSLQAVSREWESRRRWKQLSSPSASIGDSRSPIETFEDKFHGNDH